MPFCQSQVFALKDVNNDYIIQFINVTVPLCTYLTVKYVATDYEMLLYSKVIQTN